MAFFKRVYLELSRLLLFQFQDRADYGVFRNGLFSNKRQAPYNLSKAPNCYSLLDFFSSLCAITLIVFGQLLTVEEVARSICPLRLSIRPLSHTCLNRTNHRHCQRINQFRRTQNLFEILAFPWLTNRTRNTLSIFPLFQQLPRNIKPGTWWISSLRVILESHVHTSES